MCTVIQGSLALENVNSSRVISAVMKRLGDMRPSHREVVAKSIIERQLAELVADLSTGIPEASKATIEQIVGKATCYMRILQSACKLGSDLLSKTNTAVFLRCGSLLHSLQKKEAMAIKMLKPEDLEKFQTIKKTLVHSLVLQVVLDFADGERELDYALEFCLF